MLQLIDDLSSVDVQTYLAASIMTLENSSIAISAIKDSLDKDRE